MLILGHYEIEKGRFNLNFFDITAEAGACLKVLKILKSMIIMFKINGLNYERM